MEKARFFFLRYIVQATTAQLSSFKVNNCVDFTVSRDYIYSNQATLINCILGIVITTPPTSRVQSFERVDVLSRGLIRETSE